MRELSLTRHDPAALLSDDIRPFRIVLRPRKGLDRASSIAFYVLGFGALKGWLPIHASRTGALLGGLGIVGIFLAWLKLNRKAIRLDFERDRVSGFSSGGIKLWEIAYRNVRRIEVGGDNEWLMIVTDTGERKIDRYRLFERDYKTIRFVRMLHSANPDVEILWRRKRTPDEFGRFVEERHYDFPPVAMQEGITYRYIKEAMERDFKIPYQILNAVLFYAVFSLIQSNGLAALLGSLFAGFPLAYYMYPAVQMRRSGSDRFEVTAEGLKVRRGNQTWLLRDPRPSHRSSTWIPGLKGGVLKYKHGRGGYYFDPRLIEEDK